MPITLAELRRQAIRQTMFAPTTLLDAVQRLGFVQADPMAAPARAQDLILRHRVAGYRAGDLERQYPNLPLEEDVIHLYGYWPARTRRLFLPRTYRWRVEQEQPGLAEQVLAFVQENGPVDARAVDAHFGSPRTMGNWGSNAKATTKVLEMLHWRGDLRVARRQGNVRWFAGAPAVVPEGEPRERLQELVLVLARLLAPVTMSTLRQTVGWFRYGAPDLPGRRTVVEDMLRSGALVREKVEGVTYIWPTGETTEGEVPQVVRLLAPFDPVVWDRDRFEHLWGWPYRLEAYTPPEKRQFGRYALPLLWGVRVVGWASVACRKGHVEAQLGFVEGRPADPMFARELEAELDRMALFLGAGR